MALSSSSEFDAEERNGAGSREREGSKGSNVNGLSLPSGETGRMGSATPTGAEGRGSESDSVAGVCGGTRGLLESWFKCRASGRVVGVGERLVGAACWSWRRFKRARSARCAESDAEVDEDADARRALGRYALLFVCTGVVEMSHPCAPTPRVISPP